MKTNDKTAVIFRAFKEDGSVIALFPFEPATRDGWTCSSYMRVGQHSAALPEIAHNGWTRPATPAEICDLACELRGLGYKLKALRRFPRNAYARRKAELAKIGGAR